jgi:hypothetical protein
MILVSEIAALRSLCKASFFDFLREFWDVVVGEEFIYNWHIEYVCSEVEWVARRVFKGLPKEHDLVFNLPPGSTKSTILSQAFQAWTWTNFPPTRHICASYAYDLAYKDAVRCRDLVESERYQECFPEIQLREDENTKGLFTNTLKGGRLSVGVRGKLTGFHGHFLNVDDPLNPEESFSEADLRTVNRWMTNTLPLRKINKVVTPLILVQQRLAQADPSGVMIERIEKYGADAKIKLIRLPGELTPNVAPPELKAHYREGLLDPNRLPRTALDELKMVLGAYGYSAQILQEPVPLGGGMFKVQNLKIEKGLLFPPRMIRLVRSWDKAGTSGGGAFSCGVLIGVDERGDFWILDVKRGQWGATEREAVILATAAEDARGNYARLVGTSAPGPNDVEIILEIEGGSGGKESGENSVRSLTGFRVWTFHPTGDKAARAYGFASQVGIKDHVHVMDKLWTKPYVDELRYFMPDGTGSKYKDQVDGSSAGFNRIARAPRWVGGISLTQQDNIGKTPTMARKVGAL